jgi:hypothetical protein
MSEVESRAVTVHVQVRTAIHVIQKATVAMANDEIDFQVEQPLSLPAVEMLTGHLEDRLS